MSEPKDLGELVDYTDEGNEVRVVEIDTVLGLTIPVVSVVRPLPDLEEDPA